jgi:hypothetical protein
VERSWRRQLTVGRAGLKGPETVRSVTRSVGATRILPIVLMSEKSLEIFRE